MTPFLSPGAKASRSHILPAESVYVAAYLPTSSSSATMATSMRLWMVFILWLAVGFDRYRTVSEQRIYSTWLRAVGR